VGDIASAESSASGAMTPPMKPMLHGLGGGAALRGPTAHTPASDTLESSAVCTVPPRPNNVTDAGRGMGASCAVAAALSGVIAKALAGDEAATSNTGPAASSQRPLADAAVAAVSDAPARDDGTESARGRGFARSHAAATLNETINRTQRNGFIRRNLDP